MYICGEDGNSLEVILDYWTREYPGYCRDCLVWLLYYTINQAEGYADMPNVWALTCPLHTRKLPLSLVVKIVDYL